MQPIYTCDPLSAIRMGINMVHATSVPIWAIRGKYWTAVGLFFPVTSRAEFQDLKGAHARAVTRKAILGITNDLAAMFNYPATGPGPAPIANNERTLRVFPPGTSKLVREIKTQAVVVMRIGAGEDPPLILKVKNSGIRELSLYQFGNKDPAFRKWICAVKANGARLQRFRNHEKLPLEFKDAGIRKMIGLAQHNFPVLPGGAIGAGRQSNFTPVVLPVQDLEKHIPELAHANHKRIGQKRSFHIGNVLCR